MATYAPDAYAARIASGDVSPVVLVVGEEQLLADECIERLIDSALDSAAREFNLDILDAAKISVPDIVAKASSFPMMGERRVVVVQHADRLAATDKGRELFSSYLLRPSTTTRVILASEKVDGRKKPFSDIRKTFDVVECKRLQERLVPAWIQRRVKTFGKSMQTDAAELLQAYAGESLLGLLREIEKLTAYVGTRVEITGEDITQAVGATKGATVFDLQDAVGKRDLRAAASIVRRMMMSGDQPPKIIATLARHCSLLLAVADGLRRNLTPDDIAARLSIHPYRAKLMSQVVKSYSDEELINALHHLRASDRRIKTSQIDPASEIDLVLFRIIRNDDSRIPDASD